MCVSFEESLQGSLKDGRSSGLAGWAHRQPADPSSYILKPQEGTVTKPYEEPNSLSALICPAVSCMTPTPLLCRILRKHMGPP